MRRVQALSTQKSSNIAVTLAGIGLTHYPQLVLRAKLKFPGRKDKILNKFKQIAQN